MDVLVNTLRNDYPQFSFATGQHASWSSKQQQVTYNPDDPQAAWGLLHELGHALLGHTSYDSDMQLLLKETAAWEQARLLGQKYHIEINSNHIQDCLDTYRDWLHKRSTCPECGDHGLQPSQRLYRCPNCYHTWRVSASRFCRPYRLTKALTTN